MSLLEGWFKRPEEKEDLKKMITKKIDEQNALTRKTPTLDELNKAHQIPEDQELNNASEALLGEDFHNIDSINKEVVEEVLEKIELPPEEKNTELDSNYITKN